MFTIVYKAWQGYYMVGELTINSYDTIEHFIIMQLNGIYVNNKELFLECDSSQ